MIFLFPVYYPGMTEVLGPPKITVTPSQLAFIQPLPRPPVRTKANVSPKVFFGMPPLITVTPTNSGFFQPLSRPPQKSKPYGGPTIFWGELPPIAVTPTPSTWDWYQPLAVAPEITKVSVGTAVFSAPQIPPPPSFGFYQPLSTGTLLKAKQAPPLLQATFVPVTVVPAPTAGDVLYAIGTHTMNRGMMRG